MKFLILTVTLALFMGGTAPAISGAAPAPTAKRTVQILPKPGAKIPLGAKHYFIYGFTKPPKLGTAVMRVEIYTQDGARDTSFVVTGDADMPSMRGAHASGDKEFTKSAKGMYLLPVRLVMPGDWEVTMTFIKEGNKVLHGAYLFDL